MQSWKEHKKQTSHRNYVEERSSKDSSRRSSGSADKKPKSEVEEKRNNQRLESMSYVKEKQEDVAHVEDWLTDLAS